MSIPLRQQVGAPRIRAGLTGCAAGENVREIFRNDSRLMRLSGRPRMKKNATMRADGLDILKSDGFDLRCALIHRLRVRAADIVRPTVRVTVVVKAVDHKGIDHVLHPDATEHDLVQHRVPPSWDKQRNIRV